MISLLHDNKYVSGTNYNYITADNLRIKINLVEISKKFGFRNAM